MDQGLSFIPIFPYTDSSVQKAPYAQQYYNYWTQISGTASFFVIDWIVPRFPSRNNVTTYVEHNNLQRELEVAYNLTAR